MTRKRVPSRPATPAVEYPPGWFTEPVRAWGLMAPSMSGVPVDVRLQRRVEAGARQARTVALATGAGWHPHSLTLPGTCTHRMPGMLVRRKEGGE